MIIYQPDISGSVNITGSLTVTQGITGSLEGTASFASTASYSSNIDGTSNFIPVFNGTNSVSSSTIYQSGSYTSIRNSTSPEDPSAPDILYVNGDGVDTYNLISAHGDIDGYVQVNVKNNNSGVSASSDIVATADNGTETTGYIDMGINSSTFTAAGSVGVANDAYLYSTGNDLFIGNATPGKTVTIFNGGLDTTANARVFINDEGSVGINSNEITSGNPEALLVQNISTTAYNLITAKSNVDNYSQFNLKNSSDGNNASSDVVLTNDIGSETDGYIDLGINSSTYNVVGGVGGPDDSYLYAKSKHLHIGNASSGSGNNLYLFAGGTNTEDNTKITITEDGLVGIGTTTPSHSLDILGNTRLTGSLTVTGSLNVTQGITGSLLGTASFAVSASWAPGGGGSGTVTSVGGTGNVNGITLTGTVTTSGSLALGGTLSNIQSNQLATSSLMIGTTNIALGATSSLLTGLNSITATSFTGSLSGTSSYATTASYALNTAPTFIDNIVTVGLPGSNTNYTSIKSAVDSITDSAQNNTYTVRVYPGVYIEDTINMKSWISVKGDSSISTIVSASNPSQSVFIMADQSMVIDMQVQGSTAPGTPAIFYSSPTTPQTNAISYVENVRFGTNYTNAKVVGTGSAGNCIMQCSNVKYGGYPFEVGFHVTNTGSLGIGRMQLRNVTSTNGGVTGSSDQIFALADQPGCAFIVNGALLTRAVGAAAGTGFKVYNGGALRLTGVNFQRWVKGIWAPQTGSAPSIDAIALNFENCTTDVAIEHTGTTGKVSGTDNFLKTQIALEAPLYEVGQDPRKITVGKKGADFTSVSASVAYITDSSENNRYIIEVGPGAFTEKEINLTDKPYVSLIGSDIQATEIIASGSDHSIFRLRNTSEVSFMTLRGAGPGYAAFDCSDIDGFSLVHKVSIYDCDYGVKVTSTSKPSTFFGEYVDINGAFSFGTYVSSTNGVVADANMENYYLFPTEKDTTGNFATGVSGSLSLYTSKFLSSNNDNTVAIRLEDEATLEAAGLDIQGWGTGVKVPNTGEGPNFRVVGSMIHDSANYDFDIQTTKARGRFQGISNHQKINNVSENFYWNFLDDEDGENDVTRKLSVTFADGTHTDATTLIFNGSPMGVMSGGEITISGSLTINVAAGFGYLENSVNPDIYQRIDWVTDTLALSPSTNNYIYYNNASTLISAGSAPDSTQNIILGRVVTNATGIEFIDQSPYDGAHMSNKLSKFNREALGPVFSEGSIVTENVTPFKLDATQGSYFFSENNFTPAGTSSINLNQYYISGSGWNVSTSSIVPSSVYASGSQLVPMSSSYYTKHTVYLVGDGVDEKYFLVINDNQYSALVAAENATLPTIPTYFNDGVVPLAAVYVQSGSANITQIQDIRPIIGFRAAGVNASAVHGNLLGLTADDHLQYLPVNGTRQMSGDLGLGGNKLTNFSIVSGSNVTTTNITASVGNITSITGSLFGTSSWARNAVSASNIVITSDNSTDAIYYPIFSPSGSGAISARVDTDNLRYNPSTNTLTSGDLTLAAGGPRTLIMQAQGAGGTEINLQPNTTAGYARINVGNTNQPLDFQVNSIDVMTITQGYKVGIGTTGPTAKLHVRGGGVDLSTTALLVENATLSELFKVNEGGGVIQGSTNTALGVFSHAEGLSTLASASYSHAEGLGTVASGLYQHVQGRYNISSSDNSAFIIGNGTGTGTRSNLVFASGSSFQVTGSLQVSGSITGTFPTNLATARFEMGISSTTAITTGAKGRKTVPYTGTIVGWKLISDTSTTTVLDIWKTNNAIPTVANSITATAKPSLTTAQLSTSTTLTGWTTSVSPNDVFILNVDSNDNATYISLELDILLS